MHRCDDAVFTPVVRGQPGHDESLVVHTHPGVTNEKLVLFLHGFGGNRYQTWGDLPRYVFDDCPDASIGLYDYRSGSRALWPGAAIDLRDLAREIADTVRDADFTRIVLVGHSMGGILAKAVVKDLLDSGCRSADDVLAIERIAGLILMATPQAGSLRVLPGLGRTTRNFRVLRAHSRFVADLAETFRARIDTSGRHTDCNEDKVCIPTFGVIGLQDVWVDRLSSCLDLPRQQSKHVRATHTSIVKPKSRQDNAYPWILAKILECLATTYACDKPQQIGQANGWNPPPRRPRLTIDSQKRLIWIDHEQEGGLT